MKTYWHKQAQLHQSVPYMVMASAEWAGGIPVQQARKKNLDKQIKMGEKAESSLLPTVYKVSSTQRAVYFARDFRQFLEN